MIYRSNHRGIKEMDIILGRYADTHVMEMSVDELNVFETIMDEMDRDLLSWFTGEIECPKHIDKTMFEKILKFTTDSARS
jgi:antitoxin CptB